MTTTASTQAPSSTNAPGSRWRTILRRATLDEFAAAFRPDVVLETALFDGSAVGPAALRLFFNATADLYEHIAFTRETTADGCTILEWDGVAFGGQSVTGVTILAHDGVGLIAHIRLHHRPHGMVNACAAALGRALGDRLGPGVRWPSAEPGFHPNP